MKRASGFPFSFFVSHTRDGSCVRKITAKKLFGIVHQTLFYNVFWLRLCSKGISHLSKQTGISIMYHFLTQEQEFHKVFIRISFTCIWKVM